MAKKVYSKQQAQDAAEAWERWRIAALDSGEPLGHPMPFMKLYTALMDKADSDRELLRWVYPDNPKKALYATDVLRMAVNGVLTISDLSFSDAYVLFLLNEYEHRVAHRFTQISLQEQVGYPLVEGGGPLQLEEAGVVEGVVLEDDITSEDYIF